MNRDLSLMERLYCQQAKMMVLLRMKQAEQLLTSIIRLENNFGNGNGRGHLRIAISNVKESQWHEKRIVN